MVKHGDVLKRLIKLDDRSVSAIADELGISRNQLYVFFEKDVLDEYYIRKLKKMGLDVTKDDTQLLSEPLVVYGKKKGVPYYEIAATASLIEVFNDEKEVPLYNLFVPRFNNCDFAMPVFGDSMYPTLEKNDIVFYRNIDKSMIVWGKPYLIVTKKYRTIKRIYQCATSKKNITLIADNDTKNLQGYLKHPPEDVALDDVLKISIAEGVIKSFDV